ncbi:hypothetical protein [Roseibium suaedae]|uniref:Uncharacterized protein n=1 Tax=Roseibium suaedae TaxID=735517 RepID=A0A1M7L6W4_9HYPH|nr:hypothetical protein [Roseibium suaedae]SHM73094.1 hypothetical protein SAMN05444272_3076 [Roseibium suaedae]
MIEPVKPRDELFPFNIVNVDGREKAVPKENWDDYKEVALKLRSIEYLLQYDRNHGSIGLMNMIKYFGRKAMKIGNEEQKVRFRELKEIRIVWLKNHLKTRT